MSAHCSPRLDLGEKVLRTTDSNEHETNCLETIVRSDSVKSTRLENQGRPHPFPEDLLSPGTKSSFAGLYDQ